MLNTLDLESYQRRLLREVVKGQSNKEIASALGLSENTVKAYMRQLFAKTKTTNRTELALKVKGDMNVN